MLISNHMFVCKRIMKNNINSSVTESFKFKVCLFNYEWLRKERCDICWTVGGLSISGSFRWFYLSSRFIVSLLFERVYLLARDRPDGERERRPKVGRREDDEEPRGTNDEEEEGGVMKWRPVGLRRVRSMRWTPRRSIRTEPECCLNVQRTCIRTSRDVAYTVWASLVQSINSTLTCLYLMWECSD